MPTVSTTTTTKTAGNVTTTTTTTVTTDEVAAPASIDHLAAAAPVAAAPVAAAQPKGPDGNPLYITEPTERCPRWPAGATDVQTVPEAFAKCATNNAAKNALMFKANKEAAEWTPVLWSEYHANVIACGKAMMANGVEAADAVNILAFNSPEWFYAVMGVIHIAGIGAGIYGSNNPEGVRFVAAHSKAKIIFVDSKAQLDKVLSVRSELPNLKLVVMWPDNLTADPVPAGLTGVSSWADFIATGAEVDDVAFATRVASCDAAKPCFLSYTSGTTGNPKAVMHSHDTMLHASANIWNRVNSTLTEKMTADERELSYLPLSHVAGSIPMFSQLLLDDFKTVTYFAFPDALKGSLGATLKEVKPSIFIGVPRVWEKFHAALGPACGPGGPLNGKPSVYAQTALGLEKCKMCIVGAAPVANETMAFFDTIDKPIYEIYGMTENFALSHTNVAGERKIGSVGKITPDGEAKLFGETAEICTRSRSTMLGYMYNKEKTEEAIDSEGWLHTGDIGKIDDEGFYTIIGRIKEILVTAGGENVAPVLLESALKKHLPGIANVMMIGDRRKFVSAVFTLACKPDGLGGFTNELDAPSTKVDPDAKTVEDAQKSAAWTAYLDAGVAKANVEAISAAQQTKKWTILPGDFSVPGGELTPTLKLKRPVVYTKYATEIDAIYN
jgi:long-chain-fatty-acid--CoA ligase ACSBG